jgi:hypothetical protein
MIKNMTKKDSLDQSEKIGYREIFRTGKNKTYEVFHEQQWVGLNELERNELENYCEMIIGKAAFDAIEAKLKEKNT